MASYDYYREVSDECKVFEMCFKSRLPLLLKGPTGCGKSQFVNYMAMKLNREIVQVSCNEDTSATDLLGRFLIRDSDTVWQDGPVTRALRSGAILYLDEIAEAREDVIVALHSITDHRRELYLDRTGEKIIGDQNFMCVASFNPHYQRGLKQLKPSTRQRFVTINFEYPTPEIEIEVICNITNVQKNYANKLVKFASHVRGENELELQESVSTRLLIHAAKVYKMGFSERRACEIAIATCLSDDAQSTKALVDLIAIYF